MKDTIKNYLNDSEIKEYQDKATQIARKFIEMRNAQLQLQEMARNFAIDLEDTIKESIDNESEYYAVIEEKLYNSCLKYAKDIDLALREDKLIEAEIGITKEEFIRDNIDEISYFLGIDGDIYFNED